MEEVLQILFDETVYLQSEEAQRLLNVSEDHLEDSDTTRAYVQRVQSWRKLVDLAGTIPSLQDQSADEPLVGFLGHFSSGKSSLINALLRLGGAGFDLRKTDQNPTDTEITILADPEKLDIRQLRTVANLGNVSILAGPSDNELLKATSLVDTPGLGNSEEEQLLVFRFLHLCHVIVITIDGRRPLADTEKDIELLDRAFNALDGVPKIIAITSAEEFLTSRKGDFESDFDETRAKEFWNSTLTRITADDRFREFYKRLSVTPYFFVDSRDGFRVSEVLGEIYSKVNNEAELIRIQSAKKTYVIDRAADEILALRSYVESRLQKLEDLRSNTQRNANESRTLLIRVRDRLRDRLSLSVRNLESYLSGTQPSQIAITLDDKSLTQVQQRRIDNVETSLKQRLISKVEGSSNELNHWGLSTLRSNSKELDDLSNVWIEEVLTDVFDEFYDLDTTLEDVTSTLKKTAETQVETQLTDIANKRFSSADQVTVRNEVDDFLRSLQEFRREGTEYIRGFVAWVTQPQSLALLREHGVISYDQDGQLRTFDNLEDYEESDDAKAVIEQSKDSEKKISNAKFTVGLKADEEIEVGALQVSLDEELRGQLKNNLIDFLNSFRAELTAIAENEREQRAEYDKYIMQVYAADWFIASRAMAVLIIFGFLLVSAYLLSPGGFTAFFSFSSERFSDLVLAVLATVIVGGLTYIITGSSNENLRLALNFSVLERIKRLRNRKENEGQVSRILDKSIRSLRNTITQNQLNLTAKLLSKFHSLLVKTDEFVTYQTEANGILSVLSTRRSYVEKFKDSFIKNTASIADECYESAEEVRNQAVAKYLEDIDKVATDVRTLAERLQNLLQMIRSGSA